MLKKLHSHQAGDTIIEVLLALAVTVTVLTGAYVVANRALKIGRLAQERTEATKIAQGQIEAIASLARAGKLEAATIPLEGSGLPQCLPVWSTAPAWDQKAHSGNCQSNNLYDIAVVRELPIAGGYSYTPSGSGCSVNCLPFGGQFKVTITWPSLGGDTTNQKLEIRYRAYEGL